MSYVVLARKYRPRTFAEMTGQAAVVRALTHALEQRRLHHAYLFTGTRGIGKTTVSRILAKSLNCTGADGRGDITAQPCGVCTACVEIDADRYVDYIELDAASHRSIDEVRDLIERAAYKPAVGRFKVFMIDEAHQLTKDAFNALLKTLEEPPEYLKFVLATTDPERMLPTVLSRCLQFNLRPMSPDTVREHLAHVLSAEQVPHDEASLRLLGKAARGSMRDALSLTDQALAFGGGRLEAAAVAQMLGAVDASAPARLVEALARRDGAEVLAVVERLREAGQSCDATLERLIELLQQMAVEQAAPGALPAEDPDAQVARELADRLPADETQFLYALVLQGRGELGLAPDESAALAMLMLRFLAFVQTGSAAAAATPATSRPQALRRPAVVASAAVVGRSPVTADTSVASAATSCPLAAAPPPGSPSQAELHPAHVEPRPQVSPEGIMALGDRWAGIVRGLLEEQRVSGLARELAQQSQCLGIGDAEPVAVRLQVEHESLATAGARDKLAESLQVALNRLVTLDVGVGIVTESPARREAARRAQRQKQAEQALQADPVVQEILGQFRTARIVPGSIKPA